MKTDPIILWTETDDMDRAKLVRALESATQPIFSAYTAACHWDGPNLVFTPTKVCPAIRPTYYRDLYFYLSGYGDAMHQNGAMPQRPRIAP